MTFEHFNPAMLASFGIPTPKSQTFTYVNSGAANDDNIATITYKNDSGATLGVLTFTYFTTTNNISTITRTS